MEVPFRFALWLASGVLVLDPDAMDALYYQYVPCIERIGAAIDKALSGVSGDSPRSASQLRKEMRRAARRHRAAGMGQAYLVSLVDLYEVANAFPTGVGVDHCYDWIGLTSLGMLIDNEDSLTVAYGSLEQCLGLRFDDAAALAVNGPLDMLTRVIQSASDQSDALLMTDCTPQELATEVSAWVLRVQPVADELTYLCGTPLGALQLLRRQLSASHDGGLGDVVATNVGGVLRHFPLLLSVVGQSMGGAVALGMVFEIVRLAHGTVGRRLTVDELSSAMRRLEWLLPSMSTTEVMALAPTDRLTLAVSEVDRWKAQERAGGRGGGGSGARLAVEGSAGAGENTGGASGYSGAFLVQLRAMLGSQEFLKACRLIESNIEQKRFNEAIKLIFAYGYLPLIHALIGRRRSLPGLALLDTIAEILAPLGPQCVGDLLQELLLPETTGGMIRKRAPPLEAVWNLICRGATDLIPYEDACSAVKAHCSNQPPPTALAVEARFTSMERLRECEPGILGILKLMGKPNEAKGDFKTFLAKIYVFESNAHAMSRTMRNKVIQGSITAVLRENATRVALVWNSEDPTRRTVGGVVQEGSTGEAMLDTATLEVPQNTAVVNALLSVMDPDKAKAIGLCTEYVVTGTSNSGSTSSSGAATKRVAVREEGGAVRGGERAKAEPGGGSQGVGADYARLCELVGDEAHIGNKGRRDVVSKREVERVVGPRAKDKTKWCLFSALSKSKFPARCCGSPGEPGHERHDSPAHVLAVGKKKQILGLLLTAAATAGSCPVDPATTPQWAPPLAARGEGGVTWLSAPQFDGWGGLIFVPTRLRGNYSVELGVPDDDGDWWFGELLEEGLSDVRDASLATAWSWTENLFPGRADVVATGLFEDSAGANGQVTAALVPPLDAQSATSEGTRAAPGEKGDSTSPSCSARLHGPPPLDWRPANVRFPQGRTSTLTSPISPDEISTPSLDPYPQETQPMLHEMTCIDLFAGAGGLATGLSQAGFRIELLVESDARAVDVLARNGYEHALCSDVEAVDYSRWVDRLALLSGGPPCQPFSKGGLGRGGADGRDGWCAALDVVETVRPESVLFENVRGLMASKFDTYRDAITARLVGMGYHVSWHQLNAADYGVPQHRHRVFCLGFRDRAAHAAFRLPLPVLAHRTVGDVMIELGPPDGLRRHTVIGQARAYPGHRGSTLDRPAKCLVSGTHGVGGGTNSVILPNGSLRYFTVREAAALQTFPDEYCFDDTWTHAMHAIGNAVPVTLAKQLGESVAAALGAADEERARRVLRADAAAVLAEQGAEGSRLSKAALAGAAAAPGQRVRWLSVSALRGTCRERVAHAVAVRMQSLGMPCRLQPESEARTGAMAPARVLSAPQPGAATANSTLMTRDEVWSESCAAVETLRRGLASRMCELRSEGTETAQWLAGELDGWAAQLTTPPFGDIDSEVLDQAAWATDDRSTEIALPAHVRPVTTSRAPELPTRELAPPACIPGWAIGWRHAFSEQAHAATLSFLKTTRNVMRSFLSGVDIDQLWHLLPQNLAFGVDHFQRWLAELAVAGHVVGREEGRFVLVDLSRAPPSKLNRAYIRDLFDETGCTDLALRDAALTHGFPYFTNLEPQMVFQRPLRSLFVSRKGFLSVHAETLRMSQPECGWFELKGMPRLDEGEFELHSAPGRYDPNGCVGRACEERQRPIKNSSAPHQLLLTMAPPSPLLHAFGSGKRERVISTNASTGVRQSKAAVRKLREEASGSKLPPAAQRHTPGLRRAPEPYGERDDVEVGRAAGSADEERSWAGGTWTWPQEHKPFFIDLMLAMVVLAHGAYKGRRYLYIMGDDIKDMFHTFPLATLQCWTMGLLRLDPENLTEESLDAGLCAVQSRCLEMGVAPSSNWAQRFITECNHGFSKRFSRANEPLLLEIEQEQPEFARWRSARRAVSVRTGRDEAVGHWMSTYTDDLIALLIGMRSMVLFLCMHAEHYGPRGLNMRMALAVKRAIGVSARFTGAHAVTTGLMVFIPKDKVLRTDQQLRAAIEGTMLLGEWTKLVGLLNHLMCVLLMPYHAMYAIYTISDACRHARLALDEPIVLTTQGTKGLLRWLAQLRSVAGTTALAAAFATVPKWTTGVVHAMRSDAAILGTAWPALCGNLYGRVWILRLTPRWLGLPIVALEFLAGLINLLVFGQVLGGAPCALILDALVVPTVMSGKAKSPMMRWLQLRFVELVALYCLDLSVGHEFGPFNPITDAGSRGKIAELEALLRNLRLQIEYMTVPETAVRLVDDACDEWERLTADGRDETHVESEAFLAHRANAAGTAGGAAGGRAGLARAVSRRGGGGGVTALGAALLSLPSVQAAADTTSMVADQATWWLAVTVGLLTLLVAIHVVKSVLARWGWPRDLARRGLGMPIAAVEFLGELINSLNPLVFGLVLGVVAATGLAGLTPERKPFLIDVMLAVAILAHGAYKGRKYLGFMLSLPSVQAAADTTSVATSQATWWLAVTVGLLAMVMAVHLVEGVLARRARSRLQGGSGRATTAASRPRQRGAASTARKKDGERVPLLRASVRKSDAGVEGDGARRGRGQQPPGQVAARPSRRQRARAAQHSQRRAGGQGQPTVHDLLGRARQHDRATAQAAHKARALDAEKDRLAIRAAVAERAAIAHLRDAIREARSWQAAWSGSPERAGQWLSARPTAGQITGYVVRAGLPKERRARVIAELNDIVCSGEPLCDADSDARGRLAALLKEVGEEHVAAARRRAAAAIAVRRNEHPTWAAEAWANALACQQLETEARGGSSQRGTDAPPRRAAQVCSSVGVGEPGCSSVGIDEPVCSCVDGGPCCEVASRGDHGAATAHVLTPGALRALDLALAARADAARPQTRAVGCDRPPAAALGTCAKAAAAEAVRRSMGRARAACQRASVGAALVPHHVHGGLEGSGGQGGGPGGGRGAWRGVGRGGGRGGPAVVTTLLTSLGIVNADGAQESGGAPLGAQHLACGLALVCGAVLLLWLARRAIEAVLRAPWRGAKGACVAPAAVGSLPPSPPDSPVKVWVTEQRPWPTDNGRHLPASVGLAYDAWDAVMNCAINERARGLDEAGMQRWSHEFLSTVGWLLPATLSPTALGKWAATRPDSVDLSAIEALVHVYTHPVLYPLRSDPVTWLTPWCEHAVYALYGHGLPVVTWLNRLRQLHEVFEPFDRRDLHRGPPSPPPSPTTEAEPPTWVRRGTTERICDDRSTHGASGQREGTWQSKFGGWGGVMEQTTLGPHPNARSFTPDDTVAAYAAYERVRACLRSYIWLEGQWGWSSSHEFAKHADLEEAVRWLVDMMLPDPLPAMLGQRPSGRTRASPVMPLKWKALRELAIMAVITMHDERKDCGCASYPVGPPTGAGGDAPPTLSNQLERHPCSAEGLARLTELFFLQMHPWSDSPACRRLFRDLFHKWADVLHRFDRREVETKCAGGPGQTPPPRWHRGNSTTDYPVKCQDGHAAGDEPQPGLPSVWGGRLRSHSAPPSPPASPPGSSGETSPREDGKWEPPRASSTRTPSPRRARRSRRRWSRAASGSRRRCSR